MRIITAISWFLIMSLSATCPVVSQTFQSPLGAIELQIDSTKICVRLDQIEHSKFGYGILESIDRIRDIVVDDRAMDDFVVCELREGSSYLQFADSLKSLDGIYMVEPYYVDPVGRPFLVGLSFHVRFKSYVGSSTIDSLNALYGTVVARHTNEMPDVYVLQNTDSSGLGLLTLTNTYHELMETQYAEPEVKVYRELQSYKLYDYHSWRQSELKRVIGEFNVASV